MLKFAKLRSLAASQNIAGVRFKSLAVNPAINEDVTKLEPNGPKMVTEFPGPNTKKLLADLGNFQYADGARMFIDTKKSIGNYVIDVDDNIYIDMFSQIATLPLGYNHPAMIALVQDPDIIPTIINRPAIGVTPHGEFVNKLAYIVDQVAPKGLNHIMTFACGSCANENAFKLACMHYRRTKGDIGPLNEEELSSCLSNKPPGCPDYRIMSFQGGFHGRLFGSLTASTSKALHKVGFPAFNWPISKFPQYKYPLGENEQYNRLQDEEALEDTRRILTEDQSDNKIGPIVAMIIEPIQAEGGDNQASNSYFKNLRKIAEEFKVPFIVDEVQTGMGATGKFWAHEHWNLDSPPEFVTFSKKMYTGGFFTKPEFLPDIPLKINNTWQGDSLRLRMLEETIHVIKQQNLLEVVQQSGAVLQNGLKSLQNKYPNLIKNSRGLGTFLAVSFQDGTHRDRAVLTLHKNGVHCSGCGEDSLRIRVPLVFASHHAKIFLDIFEKVLANNLK